MLDVRQTRVYASWFSKLRDRRARARIDVRIRRLSLGIPGGESVILLAGGDKDAQDRDMKRALLLARNL